MGLLPIKMMLLLSSKIKQEILWFPPNQILNLNNKILTRRNKMKFGFTPEAEILNARLAMLGFVIAVGTYLTTGQIVPGIF
jgi:hypothetical protein